MCHEATSVGLPLSLGVGKGTVLLDDFRQDGTVSSSSGRTRAPTVPRMMTSLRDASEAAAATIISFNPFRERALGALSKGRRQKPGRDGDADLEHRSVLASSGSRWPETSRSSKAS